MPRFSANFRAAILAGRKFVPIVRIVWPDGTKYYGTSPRRIGGHAIEPRLIASGPIANAIPLKPGSLSFPETSLTLADADAEISRRLGTGEDARGSAVTYLWAMPDLLEADWYTHFEGLLDRPETSDDGFSQVLNVRANDTPLQGNIDKAQFLPAEFALAPATTWNIFIPRIYGSISGEDLTGKGLAPCIPWTYSAGEPAGEQYRYTPTMGFAKAIPRVYIDGVLATLTTDYEIRYPIRGGKQLTSVDLVADPGPDAIVTCDIDGIEDVGDGSGDLIVNPVDQFKHALANFGFGDFRLGLWNDPEGYPIDLESFAASSSFASAFGFAGSMRFGGDAKALKITDALQRFFTSWPCFRPFWSEDAKLALRPIDHRFFGYTSPGYTSDVVATFLRGRAQQIGLSFSDGEDTSNLIRRIDGETLFGLDGDGKTRKAFQNVAVEDVSQPDDVGESYSLEWAESRLV